MIELRTHQTVPSDTGFLAAWEQIVDRDPHGSVFHRPAFLEAWLQRLGTRVTPRIHGAYRDGELVGVIPVGREMEGSPTGPREVLHFLGGSEVTDYLGPVALPDVRDDLARVYVERLVADADWDEFVAAGLPADSGWMEALTAHAEAAGLEVGEVVEDDVCPRVDISEGFEAYLGSLPSKQRHEQRRKARKLQRDAGPVRLVDVPFEDLEDGLDAFFEMAADIGDEKSRFFLDDDMRAFFRALGRSLGPEGTFRLHQLEVGGLPAAAAVSLVHGREWGLYNSAFDETLRTLAPGMVLVTELLRVAAEEGCAVFDLLRGDEPYKYRFGAQDRVLQRTTIARR